VVFFIRLVGLGCDQQRISTRGYNGQSSIKGNIIRTRHGFLRIHLFQRVFHSSCKSENGRFYEIVQSLLLFGEAIVYIIKKMRNKCITGKIYWYIFILDCPL
jgi:hypothetical protein